jgi:hypothetical protein
MSFVQVQSLDGLPDMLAVISSLLISFRLDNFNPSVALGFSFEQMAMTKGFLIYGK